MMRMLFQDKEDPDFITQSLLYTAKLLFTLLLCGVYLMEWSSRGQTAFTALTVIIFLIVHLHYYLVRANKYALYVIGIDFAVSVSYSYVFQGSAYPNQLFVGFASLILFMRTNNRKVLIGWAAVMIIYWASILEIESYNRNAPNFINMIMNGAFIVFASIVGWLIYRNQQARLETARLNKRLQQYAAEAESLAETRERVRIAREIHDTVGHTMTALLAQQQGARKLWGRDPDKSKAMYLKCEELARSALQEIRLSVQAIQGDERKARNLVQSLDKLVTDFANLTGMDIRLHGDMSGYTVPKTLEFTIYRIVQEALTNSHKHGQATQTSVTLTCSEETVHLEISDNGRGTGQLTLGFGLLNMKERVRELQGDIDFSFHYGRKGFAIFIRFPKKGGT